MTREEISSELAKAPDLSIEERADATLYVTIPARSQAKQMIGIGAFAIIAGIVLVALYLWHPEFLHDIPFSSGSRVKLLIYGCLGVAMGFAVILMSANFGTPKPGYIEVAPAILKGLSFVAGDPIRSSFVPADVICFEAADGYLDVLTKRGNTRIMIGFGTKTCLSVGIIVGQRFWKGSEVATRKNVIHTGVGSVTTYHVFGIPNESEVAA